MKQLSIITRNSAFAYIALADLLLLAIPAIAMQFSEDVTWSAADFIIMGLLIFTMGSLFVVAARKFPRRILLIGFATIAITLYIWAELAVGIFTNLGS